jgi:phospholipid-translocating ATPase
MLDGLYQSAICFFMGYLLFAPANFVTSNGLNVNDRPRMGVYIACAVIVVVNLYILMNTYRWDWLMLLVVAISILLIWFWTGVWTASTFAETFYKAAHEVYGQLTFWALTLVTIIACLLPRFFAKAVQKIYFPRDIDIVREQVRLGKFDYLENVEPEVPPIKVSSTSSSDVSGPLKPSKRESTPVPDDERPIYPPSVAATGTTRNPRSHNGSDGTDYTGHRSSLDHPIRPQSFDRPRPSFDRMRVSIDRIRPSYEASDDFTSAALLTRVESSHSQAHPPRIPHGQSTLR